MSEAARKSYDFDDTENLNETRPVRVKPADRLEISATHSGPRGNGSEINRQSQPGYPERSQTTYPGPLPFSKLDPRYTFDQFVVGPSNQLAHEACLAVAKRLEQKRNQLFLCGPVGLGKTHLATAIAQQIAGSGSGRRLVFAPAEQFINDLHRAERHDWIERVRRVDILILDDVHFMTGRGGFQNCLLEILNELHADRHQIVLTSDRAPRDLSGFGECLIGKFESGLVAPIGPPNLETRLAILEKTAADASIELDAEVKKFIAEKVVSNVRELQGCFNRITAWASLSGREITRGFVHECLRDTNYQENVTPDIYVIQQHVSGLLHVSVADLRSKRRTQRLAFCRHVAMYLCRKLTESSFPAIGECFNRDHSTVIHAYNLIARRAKSDTAFRISMEKIERQLKGPVQAGSNDS